MSDDYSLTSVDHDPFTSLTPVDHDPFNELATYANSLPDGSSDHIGAIHTTSGSAVPFDPYEYMKDESKPLLGRLAYAVPTAIGNTIGGVAQGALSAVEGIPQSVMSGVSLPGDVLTGKVDPNSQEAIRRSFNLAGMMNSGAPNNALGAGWNGKAYDSIVSAMDKAYDSFDVEKLPLYEKMLTSTPDQLAKSPFYKDHPFVQKMLDTHDQEWSDDAMAQLQHMSDSADFAEDQHTIDHIAELSPKEAKSVYAGSPDLEQALAIHNGSSTPPPLSQVKISPSDEKWSPETIKYLQEKYNIASSGQQDEIDNLISMTPKEAKSSNPEYNSYLDQALAIHNGSTAPPMGPPLPAAKWNKGGQNYIDDLFNGMPDDHPDLNHAMNLSTTLGPVDAFKKYPDNPFLQKASDSHDLYDLDQKVAESPYYFPPKTRNDFAGPTLPLNPSGLDLSNEARMQRAQELGYNTNMPLYRGMDRNFEDHFGTFPRNNSYADPFTKQNEPGIFSATDPDIANAYAKSSAGHVSTLYSSAKNPRVVDWSKYASSGDYNGPDMVRLLKESLAQGHDAVHIKNIYDMGSISPQEQYVSFNPNQLRSKFAAFDPKYKDSANLLSSRGLPIPMSVTPVDHDPFDDQH